MSLNLEGFLHSTSLDLNVGFHHIELNPCAKRSRTVVLLFAKFECQRLHVGLCNSPNKGQEMMSDLMDGSDFVQNLSHHIHL